jgi:nucleoid DNA-binding protein
MASSRIGLEILIEKAAKAFGVRKKAARDIVGKFIDCLEETLLDNLETDGFSVKLNKFGKLTIRHRAASLRKIPLTGEIKMTSRKRKVKFLTLGKLREQEKAPVVLVPPSLASEVPQSPEAPVQEDTTQ